jgi:hypothetical protein
VVILDPDGDTPETVAVHGVGQARVVEAGQLVVRVDRRTAD